MAYSIQTNFSISISRKRSYEELPDIKRLRITDSDEELPDIKKLRITNSPEKSLLYTNPDVSSCCALQGYSSVLKIDSINSFFDMNQAETIKNTRIYTIHKVHCIQHHQVVVLKELNLTCVRGVFHNKEVVNLLPEKRSPHFIRFFGEFVNNAIVTDIKQIFRVKRYLAYEYIESGYSLSKISSGICDITFPYRRNISKLLLIEKHMNYIFYQLLEIYNALYKAHIEFFHLQPKDFIYCPTKSIIKVVLFENAAVENEEDSLMIHYPGRQLDNIRHCIATIFKAYLLDYNIDSLLFYSKVTEAQWISCYSKKGWLEREALFNNITKKILICSWGFEVIIPATLKMNIINNIKHINYDRLMEFKDALKRTSTPLPLLSNLYPARVNAE
ncbi:MAG: hypothetical protein HAW62_04445 [Endozoicomonadaceae bacterium]|nr:hypothetical protein [Endozoicomonadaceae bacterium]